MHRLWMPAAIFALNLFLVRHYVTGEYFEIGRQSIEGAYLALARWWADGRSPFGWLPEWYCGNPFRYTYPPLLHFWVGKSYALLRSLGPARHYHFWTGIFYCLGPVTLYLLIKYLTARRRLAFMFALGYSVLEAADLLPALTPQIWPGTPGRFEALAAYGEGPHIAALTLLPLALLFLLRLLDDPSRKRFAAAAIALAAVPLTNWIGGFALLMTASALVAARLAAGDRKAPLRAGAAAMFAWLLAAFWITPDFAWIQSRNSNIFTGTTYGWFQVVIAGCFAAASALLLALFGRRKDGWRTGWIVVSTAAFALLVFAQPIWGRDLLTQGHRYVPELELGIWLLGADVAARLWDRGRAARAACLAASLAFVLAAGHRVPRQFLWPRGDFPERLRNLESTPEYRVAQWLETNAAGSRVFVRGSILFWLHAWSDVHTVGGGSDPGILNERLFEGSFAITWSERPATREDLERARFWLDALGADYVVVAGPESREIYKDFNDPNEFAGWAKVWDSGAGEAIYRVPRPKRGIVQAAGEASYAWRGTSRLELTTTTGPGEAVLVQVTHHPGWRAFEDGRPLAVEKTPIGLIEVRPERAGSHRIVLAFGATAGERVARWISVLALCGAGLLIKPRVRLRSPWRRW